MGNRTDRRNLGIGFDLSFGVVLPAICFALDPVVFRNGFGSPMLPPSWRVPLLSIAGVAALALAVRLLTRGRRGPGRLLLLPPLLAGALLSLFFAAVLLPLAVPAAIVLIGLLGLVPVATALVHLRHFVDGMRECSPGRRRAALALTVVVLVAAGAPLWIAEQRRVPPGESVAEALLPRVLEGPTPDDVRTAIDVVVRLDPTHRTKATRTLMGAYRNLPPDSELAPVFREAWRRATGRDLDRDAGGLLD